MGSPGTKPPWTDDALGAAVRDSRGIELDHVNGDETANRLENLRLLCPDCHSQTDTYRGRNIGRKPWWVRERPGWRNR